MYYRLKKYFLQKIFSTAGKKTGTMANLVKVSGIPKSTLYEYKNGSRVIPHVPLRRILVISNKKMDKHAILETFPHNWRQVRGGKNCVKKKIIDGTLSNQLIFARKKARIASSQWHKNMREHSPEEYYQFQHTKFKLIGHDKYITKKGERVRNLFERETANWLFRHKIKYVYEPLIKIDGKTFFPDFLIDNKTIIECTAWKGYDKAVKLQDKISFLEKKYNVFVLIPKALYNYYQTLNNRVIFELHTDMFP